MDNKVLVSELDQAKSAIESLGQTKTKLELYVQNLENQKMEMLEACKQKGLPTDMTELESFIKTGVEQIEVQSAAVKNLLLEVSTLQVSIQNELGIK